jgi:DNA-binding MarR family transcriptional regulator
MAKNPQEHAAWLKLDKPEHIIGFLLKSLHHTLRQTVDESLRKEGLELSFAHFAALYGLHCEPGITGAQLARRAMVSAQTMNSVLRRLEIEGRIVRRPHPESRRADSWSLTDAGVALLGEARKVGSTVFSKMLAPLDTDEIAGLESYLRRCLAALGATVGESALRDPAMLEAPLVAKVPRRHGQNRPSRRPQERRPPAR